ncbi:MFS transporter [Ponticaulis profundi]|uniref:MFS transporter n=1 Tax=Ponticaulis profundi TaxID=2665222 RepID=A0ABW1S806_9PROT
MTVVVDENAVPPLISEPEVSKKIKIGWATGALGVAILMNSIGMLALFYMVSVLKINPMLAGTLIFVTKIFDVISDPVVGRWSDSIRSDKSRRRPFLLVGAVLSGLSFILIFTTPMFESQWMRAAYVFVAMMIYTLGYTIFNVPYMAMPAEMTDNYHERSSIHGYRMVYISIANLVAGALAPFILDQMGRLEWMSYFYVGIGGGIIITASMLVAWKSTGKAKFTHAAEDVPRIFQELGHVFSNRHFIRLLGVKACQLIGIASAQAAGIFFLLNVLQRDMTFMVYSGIVVGIVSLLFVPLVVRISKRIGKSKTYILAALVYVVVVASWTLGQAGEPLWSYILRSACLSFSASGNIIMAMSMLTDIINHDAKKTGVRREGVYTAFYSFTEKFTFAFGPLIVGVALGLAGFDQNLPPEEMTSPEIRQALLLGIAYIPAAMGLLSIFLLSGYKLKEEDLQK